MGNERFSLMTMNLAKEMIRGSINVEDSLRLAAERGIPHANLPTFTVTTGIWVTPAWAIRPTPSSIRRTAVC